MNTRFSGGFHRPLIGNPNDRLLCWGRVVRQSSCPATFAEVGFELVASSMPDIILVPQIQDLDVLAHLEGVADGIGALIGDPPGPFGGFEIHWVHGIEHPVDSHRRAFRIATEAALSQALGEPRTDRGITSGIGFTSRTAAQAASNPRS